MIIDSKCCLALTLVLSGWSSFGHDVPVHRKITQHAVASALAGSPAFADFLATVSSDSDPNITTNLVEGSAREDDPNKDEGFPLEDGGGLRSLNHFYDPLDGMYDKGLSDYPTDLRKREGTNSFAWASISNCMGFNFTGGSFLFWHHIGQNVNKSNQWSWQNARGYEWLGLTETNRSDRQLSLSRMFRAVGQVMHLLEDTTQPQHVRNEQHLDRLGPVWESPIEDYGRDNQTNLNYQHGMLLWRTNGFTKLGDFWDRGFYKISLANALIDDSAAVDPTKALGLAEFTSGNFLGARHLYGEYYARTNIKYYPYPSRNSSTDFMQRRANLASGVDAFAFKNGAQGHAIYLNKAKDGATVAHHSRFTYFGARFPNFGMITINDSNVLQDYHAILIPKAVKYSAGLLDYFFRGTVTSVIGYDTNTEQSTIVVMNTSGQDFYGGSFSVYHDDNDGVRSLMFQTNYTGKTLANTNSLILTFTNATSLTNKLLLVYQGNIGITNGSTALDPVDVNIAIAVGPVTPGWHSSFETGSYLNVFSAGDHLPEGWVVDFGQVDLDDRNSAAFEGDWFVDLNGWEPGGISTDVVTVPGQSYTLSFVYARNPGSITGEAGPVNIIPQAQILVGGNLLGTVAPDSENSWESLDWQTTNYVFTATSTATHLTFQSVDTDGASGVLIDAIDIKPN